MPRGLGPVFVFEWIIASRRWQSYALRSLLVAGLLLALTVVWFSTLGWKQNLSLEDIGKIGRPFFIALVGTQLALVMLAAPASAAGAFCLDKARGTLQHLMVTDLSDHEIVLGKLAAKLLPILGLVLCSMPVLALSALLGGIDLMALLGAYMVTLGVAVLSCTLALTLSLWGRKTHEVLLLNYLIWMGLLLAYPLARYLDRELFNNLLVPTELARLNPFWLAFLPYVEPGTDNLMEAGIMLGTCLILSLGLALLMVLCFRRVVLSQSGRVERATKTKTERWSWKGFDYLGPFGPTLDGNPVLWREWQRRKLSFGMRIVWGVYALGAIGVSAFTAIHCYYFDGDRGMAAWVNGLQIPIGLLLVGLTAATCFIEERIRGSLDVLLCTPLPTATIFWGKWLGAFRPVPVLTLLPALVGLSLALESGRLDLWLLLIVIVIAHGAAVVSLGLAVAVWVRQQGRAIAITAGLYVIVTAAAPLVLFASGFHSDEMEGLAAVSSFFGPGSLTFMISEGPGPRSIMGWLIFWLGVHAAVALVLGAAAALSFDSCMGRVSEMSHAKRGRGSFGERV